MKIQNKLREYSNIFKVLLILDDYV